jgi:hypothetical protein
LDPQMRSMSHLFQSWLGANLSYFSLWLLKFAIWVFTIYAMSSSKSAMKRTDECDVCGKMFHTVKAYNQHLRSFYLRGTGCFALPEQTRVNVVAAARPNMSTAAVERRPAKRTRGTENMNYLCIFSILYIFCISRKISKRASPLR